MLYAKIDGDGNPVEVAKSYKLIQREFQQKGSIIPAESIFENKSVSLGYAPIPQNEPPAPKEGKNLVPDIPVKKSDGTYERTWKYVDPTDLDIKNMNNVMRNRRNKALNFYIDSISPVRWNSMNSADKSTVEAYYQELLDLPAQAAWPFVTLPNVPEILK